MMVLPKMSMSTWPNFLTTKSSLGQQSICMSRELSGSLQAVVESLEPFLAKSIPLLFPHLTFVHLSYCVHPSYFLCVSFILHTSLWFFLLFHACASFLLCVSFLLLIFVHPSSAHPSEFLFYGCTCFLLCASFILCCLCGRFSK